MVDKVTRIMKQPEQIRNIAICAHIDHGKTTLTDNLLAGAGMMSEELAGKQLLMDFHDDEQERGITIDTASVSMVHELEGKEYLFNRFGVGASLFDLMSAPWGDRIRYALYILR